MARKFYAIYHPYGIRMMSNGDCLYRYDNAAARAEDAERVDLQAKDDGRGFLMEEVTRDEARRLFPEAFRPGNVVWRSGTDGDRYFDGPWWRDYEDGSQEWTGRPTGGSYKYL